MPSLMKGHLWKDRRDAVDRKGNPVVTYPVYAEDKHDEIRCHVCIQGTDVLYLSYAGKPLANMERFDEVFRTLSRGTGWTEFDLGFEVNHNFNDSYRWVRSTKGLPDDLKNAYVRFFVFGLPQKQTGGMLQQMLVRLEVARYAADWVSVPFETPFCIVCNSADEVDAAFLNARERGREGLMIKQVHAQYQRKRTDGWLKMKPEDDADGVIEDIYEATSEDGTPLGRAGSVKVVCEDGSTACPHGIPHELGKHMWQYKHEYIGKWCEFKYMERDRQGGYRHPTFHRIREDKK